MRYEPPKPPIEMTARWKWCTICGRAIGKCPDPPWIRVKGLHTWCVLKWIWQCLNH